MLGAVVVAGVFSANAGAHRRPPLHHITLFGASSAAALNWDATARAQLTKANRVTFELQPCGRLSTPGCFTPPPPSVLSRVRPLGRRTGPAAGGLIRSTATPTCAT